MAYYQQGYQQPGGYQQGYQPQQMYQQYQQPSQQYGNYGGYFQQNVFSVNAWQVSYPRTNSYMCNVYTMGGSRYFEYVSGNGAGEGGGSGDKYVYVCGLLLIIYLN